MSTTIIDQLVVTLGLKPESFTKGVKDADSAQTKFSSGIKSLDAHERKLTETQKIAVRNLRDSASQAERTKKELTAASGAGKQFWGVLEKGALAFGAALGVAGIAEMAKDAVTSNAAIDRLSKTLGMGARDADAWGKAIEQKVGGNAGAALGTIQGLNRALQGIRFGRVPTDLLLATAQAASVAGKPMPNIMGPNGPVSASDFIRQMSPIVRALGQEKADAQLGSIFDEGTLRFMGLSDKDQAAALAEARKNTPGGADPYGDAEKLRQETADLTQAFGTLRDTVMLMAAPALTLGIKNLIAVLRYVAHPLAPGAKEAMDAEINKNDAEFWGPEWVKKQADQHNKDEAARIVDNTQWEAPTPVDSSGHAHPVYNPKHTTPWTRDQRLARAQQLLEQGEDAFTIPSIIAAEEADGRAPGRQTPVVPLGVSPGGAPGGIDSILDGIRDLGEKSGNNAVSPKGARGRYQFIPATAARYGLTDPTNETMSREAARKYITDLYAEFHDVTKAVAAYNMGEGALRNDIKAHGANWRQFLPQETASYLDRMAPVLAGAGGGGTTITVAVNGPTTINTKATDADGLKRDLSHHWALVAQNQSGPH